MVASQTSLEEDERYDLQIVKEGLSREKNLIKLSQWLSEKFSYRYGPDFAGRVDIKYDLVSRLFRVNCSDGSSFILDHDRILEMPAYIRVMRLRARRSKKINSGTIVDNKLQKFNAI